MPAACTNNDNESTMVTSRAPRRRMSTMEALEESPNSLARRIDSCSTPRPVSMAREDVDDESPASRNAARKRKHAGSTPSLSLLLAPQGPPTSPPETILSSTGSALAVQTQSPSLSLLAPQGPPTSPPETILSSTGSAMADQTQSARIDRPCRKAKQIGEDRRLATAVATAEAYNRLSPSAGTKPATSSREPKKGSGGSRKKNKEPEDTLATFRLIPRSARKTKRQGTPPFASQLDKVISESTAMDAMDSLARVSGFTPQLSEKFASAAAERETEKDEGESVSESSLNVDRNSDVSAAVSKLNHHDSAVDDDHLNDQKELSCAASTMEDDDHHKLESSPATDIPDHVTVPEKDEETQREMSLDAPGVNLGNSDEKIPTEVEQTTLPQPREGEQENSSEINVDQTLSEKDGRSQGDTSLDVPGVNIVENPKEMIPMAVEQTTLPGPRKDEQENGYELQVINPAMHKTTQDTANINSTDESGLLEGKTPTQAVAAAEAIGEYAEIVSDDSSTCDREKMLEVYNVRCQPELVEGDRKPSATRTPPSETYYVEETAWKKYNPPEPSSEKNIEGAVATNDLKPLPPAPPLPTFPTTGKCQWSFDEKSRVLLANFEREDGTVEVGLEDEQFLLEMMERDDITVLSYGLANGLDKELWNLGYIVNAVGDEYYHKFRVFEKQTPAEPNTIPKELRNSQTIVVADVSNEDTSTGKRGDDGPEKPSINGHPLNETGTNQGNDAENAVDMIAERFSPVKYRETDQCMSMKVFDYVRYLGMRQAVLEQTQEAHPERENEGMVFTFVNHLGQEHSVNVTDVVLYMIDFDMVKLLPQLYDDLRDKFGLGGCLPGGVHCMMNSINANGRPFMGPNLYCTPPESFTQMHQDGHGTVDSGHLCLSGYNEVVIFRRLTERHKMNALALLKGQGSELKYDGLGDLPHGDNLGEKPDWPRIDAIEACHKMNYCPSVFILKPGQLVHINKGRLHAFRKLSPAPLAPTDCHAALRAALLATSNLRSEDLICFSVAWDWMYRGVTSEGISREVLAILECATLNNRIHGRQSLAIPELCLLQMARIMTPMESTPKMNSLSLLGFPVDLSSRSSKGFAPQTVDILRGILPGLRYVVNQHVAASDKAIASKRDSSSSGPRVSMRQRPDSWEDPLSCPVDPYGNSDYFCKLCSKELSNVYLHCVGCEVLLNKDFNICAECWESQNFKRTIQMHPLNEKRHSTINHTGDMKYDRSSYCPCKNGPVCRGCQYCAGCSCKCHQEFTLHYRFFAVEDEKDLVHRVEAIVGQHHVQFSEQAVPRLQAALRPIRSTTSQSTVDSHATKKHDRDNADTASETAPAKKQKRSRVKGERRKVTKSTVSRSRSKASAIITKSASKAIANSPVIKVSGFDTEISELLRAFDVTNRPDELRPAICPATKPVSKDDLSDGALAYTEPRGQFPALSRRGYISGFGQCDYESLCKFIEEANRLKVRTPSSIRELLPETSSLTENDARHLYRNFADLDKDNFRVNPQHSRYPHIRFSRRECDIIIFAIEKGRKWADIETLIPYRPAKNIAWVHKLVGNKRNVFAEPYLACEPYMRHLEETVGLLLSLEADKLVTATKGSVQKLGGGPSVRQHRNGVASMKAETGEQTSVASRKFASKTGENGSVPKEGVRRSTRRRPADPAGEKDDAPIEQTTLPADRTHKRAPPNNGMVKNVVVTQPARTSRQLSRGTLLAEKDASFASEESSIQQRGRKRCRGDAASEKDDAPAEQINVASGKVVSIASEGRKDDAASEKDDAPDKLRNVASGKDASIASEESSVRERGVEERRGDAASEKDDDPAE